MKLKLAFLFLTLSVALTSCGKPASDEEEYDGITRVTGTAAFGNQCPYGTYEDPRPAKLSALDCQGIPRIEFVENPQPLLLQADCKKKSLVIRSADGKLDSFWEVMPDGSFFVTVDTGRVRLKTAGAGNNGCVTYTSSDVWGKLTCTDRDRATIQFETVWWPGKGKKPTRSDSADSECNLPPGCYFHATASIRQCR